MPGRINQNTQNLRGVGGNATTDNAQDLQREQVDQFTHLNKLFTKTINDLAKYTSKKMKEEIGKTTEATEAYKQVLQKQTAIEAAKQTRELNEQIIKEVGKRSTLGQKLTEENKQLTKSLVAAGEETSTGIKVLTKTVNLINSAMSSISNKLDQYIEVYSSYAGDINTRLQGTSKTFDSISDTINKNLAGNPYVSMTDMYKNLSSLVEAGISYNVEQRAFLMTVSDRIATTFDAANSTLLRIIRLQQADSTAARLGMESYLTKFLNEMYEDTSYLSDVYDSVESSLTNAISMLSTTGGAELESVVQTWLGSLYSVGFDSGTLTSIAEGLNYLATGDVNSLSSNEALQNLLVMSASKAGLDYSSLLVNGLSASNANSLLAGMVEYLQEIAGSGNNVVLSQYASLFGVNISDLVASTNLLASDIETIYNTTMSYSDMIAETNSELATIGQRMTQSEMANNLIDSIMMSSASEIVDNIGAYATYMIADILDSVAGGINIPVTSIMGNSVDLKANVSDLLKTGLFGYGFLSNIGTIVSNVFGAGNGLSLDNWGASETTARGSGFSGVTSGVSETTSNSLYVGNSSGSDIYSSTITAAKNEATSSITGQEQEAADQAEQMYSDVSRIAEILEAVLSGSNALRVVVESYGLSNVSSTL